LQHRKHTGKLLSHKHTSYRALFLVLMITGAFLGSLQFAIAHAADFEVTAKLSAVVPTVPATIDSPTLNLVVQQAPLTVSGTCQVMSPMAIVAIYRGSDVLGSTFCQSDGTFSVIITLRSGVNQLFARTFNITNDPGPDSAPSTITYRPPVVAEPQASPDPEAPPEETSPPTGQPGAVLGLNSKDAFLIFGPDKPATWVGSISGGELPYRLKVDWGDGTIQTKDELGSEGIERSHTYKTMKSYFVTLTAHDTHNQAASFQLAAITPNQPNDASTSDGQDAAAGTTATPGSTGGSALATFGKIYAVYAGTVGVGLLAWYDAHILQLSFFGHHTGSASQFKGRGRGRFR